MRAKKAKLLLRTEMMEVENFDNKRKKGNAENNWNVETNPKITRGNKDNEILVKQFKDTLILVPNSNSEKCHIVLCVDVDSRGETS